MRWWFLGLVALVSGCVMPGAGQSTGVVEEAMVPGKGQLVLHWLAETGSRAVLGSAWASEKADAFELLLVGPTVRSVEVTGGTQVLSVDPGLWRVLLLAGVKRSSGSSTAYLVGSAGAEGVTVVDGQRTEVSLVLRSVDLGLAALTPAYWKGSVTFQATGKTRNPRVGMSLAGASTTSRPRLKSVELWNGYREMASISGTPDDWVALASGTVPDGAPSVVVDLVGAGLCFQDAADQWQPTAGQTKFSWFWPNRADLTETHPLAVWTEVVVPAVPPPTGVNVSVTWE